MMFKSVIAKELELFVQYRISSEKMSEIPLQNLRYFDKFCAERYPKAGSLSQEMVNNWCEKRNTENNTSCRSRTGIICSFLKYARRRKWTSIHMPPDLPCIERSTFVPHPFSEEELKAFFTACDSIVIKHPNALSHRLHKVIAPVFFRLLYSTGMRTNEARNLERKDVDLQTGVININKSKGGNQHRVALHRSMNALLVQYDATVEKLMPNRKYFFPNAKDKPHYRNWQAKNFSILWKQCNGSKARAYDLRSLYATTNINKWTDPGMEWYSKFIYLSRSMGHLHLQSTAHYYHLVPYMADILKELTEKGINMIVPEIPESNLNIHENEE